MKITKILMILLAFSFFSTVAMSSPQDKEGKGKSAKGNSQQTQEKLDSRIEKWVQKTCGDDVACADKKRTEYQERMANYKQHVKKKCGDDKACRQEMRAKYMERRAKREARITKKCGDDEACRDDLREKYSLKMKDARKKCGDDKACWEKFYKENKPKKN